MAKISLNLSLFNHTGSNQTGRLTVKISPENFKGKSFQFTKTVAVGSDASNLIEMNPENTKELIINNPASGGPMDTETQLYRIRLQFTGHQVCRMIQLFFLASGL